MTPRSTLMAAAIIAFLTPTLGEAQQNITWVSKTGDIFNPCTQTAPCSSFAAAYERTVTGGLIAVLDPGDYGPVTITRSITIDGAGSMARILPGIGPFGILVNAEPTSLVILRNLSIEGLGLSTDGIRYMNGGALVVENVTVTGITGAGLTANLPGSGLLTVVNSSFRGGVVGVRAATAGSLKLLLDNVSVVHAAKGIYAMHIGTKVVAKNSTFAHNTLGVLAESSGTVDLFNSTVSGNTTGLQAEFGGLLRASGNQILENETGFKCGSGVIQSAGNNTSGGNGAGCGFAAGFVIQ